MVSQLNQDWQDHSSCVFGRPYTNEKRSKYIIIRCVVSQLNSQTYITIGSIHLIWLSGNGKPCLKYPQFLRLYASQHNISDNPLYFFGHKATLN